MNEEIVSERRGSTGEIRINRPRALNALNGAMFAEIGRVLDEWRDRLGQSPHVDVVVVRGEGGNFSAGGDIRFVRDLVLAGDDAGIATMYSTEYRLNAQIARYPVEYVAAVDGYCMGGGLGVAMYGDVVAVSERARLAMPEVGIGFFPDVGASYVLSRLSDRIGWYMGLTGARLSGIDAVACGLATHLLDDATFERAVQIVEHADAVAGTMTDNFDAVATKPAHAPIDALRPAIARCFGAGDVSGVMQALEREGTPWAAETLATMRRASPASLAITFELFRRGSTLALEECLEMEYQLAVRICKTPEFLEGVRAMVIDKDRTPRWDPPSVEALRPEALESLWSDIDISRNELGLR